MPDPDRDEAISGQSGGSPSPGEPDFPTAGRLLGLDYGSKRVGVAVSNAEQTIASPLEMWVRRTAVLDAIRLRELVNEYEAVGLVVGLPVHMSAMEGAKAREAKRFGRWAASASGLPVRFFDERFTTAQAEEHLLASAMTRRQRKDRLDKVAAQIMLQSYLDAPDRGRAPADLRR